MDNNTEMKMKTKTIEFFQVGGYEATLKAATTEFAQKNPGTTVAHATFSYARPGDKDGRWVGIDITYETT